MEQVRDLKVWESEKEPFSPHGYYCDLVLEGITDTCLKRYDDIIL